MGCIGSFFGSCIGSCCCSAIGNTCKTDSQSSRLPYIITYFIWGVLAIVLSQWGGSVVDLKVWDIEICSDTCKGNGIAFRFSCCLVAFFGAHVLIISIPMMGWFHTFGFLFKLIALTGLTIWSFWWDSPPMDTYADVARVASGFFLLIQIFLIVIWADDTNDRIFARIQGDDGEADPNLMYCVIFWVFAFMVGSWVLCGFYFGWYAPSGCGLNQFLIVLTIAYTLFNSVLSATKFAPYGNIYTSAIVQFYCTWLLFTALASDHTTCNTQAGSDGMEHGGPAMWIGVVLITIALSLMGYKTTTAFHSHDEEEALKSKDEEIKSAEEEGGRKEDSKEDQENFAMKKANITFHLIMTCGSFYMAMLLSNWGVQEVKGSSGSVFANDANKWIIIIAQWFSMLLYTWNLIAPTVGPKCCPDRDWGQDD